ncbi:synaptotagmin-8 [Herpailurus yagouaroundi]|uniref:synaptotagmin-8 n=1 Tax=Herpailurus yagouaroundi TaxID=1608482 RepID=UPI001AD60780|nr:synaptotagmin-8 [Puma yagouaroundi]XP_040321811.1 synaptotagmin-8 [Puma yagouaroundi]XP_040321812.1 synaptotagmin-8 [Puma yagouaroundi]XP_040321813.1 synaptotagmin-8 [Puma yagouaroundi]
MGRPPDAHSTLAPAGTTTVPGLIPDLVARLPWPSWALTAVAVAAGVLAVSCLLCVACCCCRQGCRKKPRGQEAVGLGGPQGTTSIHLVQPDVESSESAPGGPRHWGRLLLSLGYDFGSQEIQVGLRQAADLRAGGPGGTADPYARVSLSTGAGHTHETRVHRGTLCPTFQETCRFHVPQRELARTALWVQVLSFRRFSAHEPLAELRLPLGTVDPQHVLEQWYQLGPPGTTEPEPLGGLCLSLRYVPGSGRLTVVVLEARGLSPGLADPYVKVQLMLNQRKWKKRKTSARKGTAAPYFNEAFTFLVPFSQVQSVDLVLAVWARGPHFRAEPVGEVLLGARASGQALRHWADMLAHARRPVAQWHRLRPAGEVDGALALKPCLHLPLPGS